MKINGLRWWVVILVAIAAIMSIGVWSAATLLHAFAQGLLSFSIFRSILGIAEAGNWPIWWLFIVWIPIYLSEVFGMNVKEIAFSAWLPYVGAMIGAWFGGLLAQNRLGAGWSADKTRKMVITLGCLIMIPCFFLLRAPGTALNAVLIMAVLLFGFQTAIGNVQTLPSDMFSGKIVGTLSGFAGMAAKLGAAALTIVVPMITTGGNYTPAFIIGGVLALIALAAIWILCPRIEPLKPKHF